MLDVAQAFAWTRMFAGYAKNESVVAAVRDTFDPGRPCALCCALGKARQAAGQHGPALPSAGGDRMILILEGPDVYVAVQAQRAWPDAPFAVTAARARDVPVPPPRAVLA
jgi:hypothetical protein